MQNMENQERAFHDVIPGYYLGIDAGGTKTEFLLQDGQGNTIAHTILGTANPNDIGMEQCQQVLGEGIRFCCQNIPYEKTAMFAGIAGGTGGNNREELAAFFRKFGFYIFDNHNDLESALEAALHGGDGVVLITGTGISCIAVHKGQRKRVGGWGYLLDSGGSGYNLGRDALEAAFCAIDGRGQQTMLLQMIERKLECSVISAVSKIYQGGKTFIAEFAPLVFEACELGDVAAQEILERNVLEMARIAQAGVAFAEGFEVPIVLCGGLTKRADLWLDRFKKEFGKNQRIDILSEPVINGALVLAKKIAGAGKEECIL